MVRPSNRSKNNVTRSILPPFSIHGMWGQQKDILRWPSQQQQQQNNPCFKKLIEDSNVFIEVCSEPYYQSSYGWRKMHLGCTLFCKTHNQSLTLRPELFYNIGHRSNISSSSSKLFLVELKYLQEIFRTQSLHLSFYFVSIKHSSRGALQQKEMNNRISSTREHSLLGEGSLYAGLQFNKTGFDQKRKYAEM